MDISIHFIFFSALTASLCSRLPGRLCLGCHGSLQLDWESDVLAVMISPSDTGTSPPGPCLTSPPSPPSLPTGRWRRPVRSPSTALSSLQEIMNICPSLDSLTLRTLRKIINSPRLKDEVESIWGKNFFCKLHGNISVKSLSPLWYSYSKGDDLQNIRQLERVNGSFSQSSHSPHPSHLSESISARYFVPRTFLSVVAPSRCVECLKSSTLLVAMMGLKTRQ